MFRKKDESLEYLLYETTNKGVKLNDDVSRARIDEERQKFFEQMVDKNKRKDEKRSRGVTLSNSITEANIASTQAAMTSSGNTAKIIALKSMGVTADDIATFNQFI